MIGGWEPRSMRKPTKRGLQRRERGWRLVVVTMIAMGTMTIPATAAQKQTPDAFLRQVVTFLNDGRYERAYALLHPAQQALGPEGKFVSCQQQQPSPQVKVRRMVAKDKVKVTIPGTSRRVDAIAVTFEVEIAGERGNVTLRALQNGPAWAWGTTDDCFLTKR